MSAIATAIAGKGLENGKYRDLDRDHPELEKFKRMQKAGLPQGAIENALMRDGILPSSLFDAPINNPTGAPQPLTLSLPKPAEAPATSTSKPVSDPSKPPPGMSLIEEMKWRQANSKLKAAGESGVNTLKLAERKKSVVQPQRMVALRPSGSTIVAGEKSTEAPKLNAALAPAVRPTPKGPLPGVNPAAKYTAPVYSSVLRPTPKPSDRKPSVVVPSFIKPKTDSKTPAAELPKVEIDFMPLPSQQLLPPPNPLETQILDDGTKLTRDKDGGLTQENPNGVIIRVFVDGASKQTNPDGTIIEVSADGTKTIQTEPDGTRIENYQGETLTCFPDGVIVRTLANGEKHQTMPDGTTIHTYTDGRTVQTKDQIEITSYPDGSSDQLDKATGKKLHRSKDGVVCAA